jgi:hypothetical protein
MPEEEKKAAKSYLPKNFELTSEFQEIFYLIENTEICVFITGKAGTGKSTLIEYLRENTKKKAVFIAPTGVAALNIRGKTIHSFFKFPPQVITSDAIKDNKYGEEKKSIFKSVDLIVIDEISMVRADLIQGIDFVLRNYGKSNLPFGGIQMVLVGYMYQLPPVIDQNDKINITHNGEIIFEGSLHHYFERKYKGHYFFNSDAFKNANFKYCVLNTIFRQKDDNKFMEILNAIRENKISGEILRQLNERHFENIEESETGEIVLCATNNIASEINKRKMDELPTKAFLYEAEVKGIFEKEIPEKDYPAEKYLILKEQAQVMMIKNDISGRWVNGSIGIIKTLAENKIEVEINGTIFEVNKETWEAIDYKYDAKNDKLDTNIIGEYKQYPVKLAWAITIHKSQGKTFEKTIIDLGNGAFAHGQTYVALSRCKTLDGIRLKNPIKHKDVILDDKVVRFISGMTQ